jgi:hypothetical protein
MFQFLSNSSEIFFLFGIILKLIDDHEDGLIRIMSQNTCLLLKCAFIIITLVTFTIDAHFVDDYMYVVLSMAFIENSLVNQYGEIMKFYLLHGIITLLFFIYHVYKKHINIHSYIYVFVKLTDIYSWLYLENILFQENNSEFKVFYRTYLVIITVLYQQHIISNLKNMTVAYMTISIVNMTLISQLLLNDKSRNTFVDS